MANPVPGRSISTAYGRRGPYWGCNKNAQGGVHTGADWAAPAGTQIVAPIAGQIRHRNYGSAFGKHQFAISPDANQPFGRGEVFFAHTSTRLPDGTRVDIGTPIAKVGAEGNVTGPHLHMEYHPTTKGSWSCAACADPAPIVSATGGGAKGILYRVNTKAGLYARKTPNGANVIRNGQKLVRPYGFKVRVVATRKAGGRTWAQGSGGLWYAAQYLKKA